MTVSDLVLTDESGVPLTDEHGYWLTIAESPDQTGAIATVPVSRYTVARSISAYTTGVPVSRYTVARSISAYTTGVPIVVYTTQEVLA